MRAEMNLLLRTAKTRLLTLLLIAGVVIGTVPLAAVNANAVMVTPSAYVDGGGGQQGIDIYSTGGSNKPGIIFVHGGGWRAGDKNQYVGLGHNAAQRGFVAASINYRLGSAGVYYQYEDVMRAVQHIRQNAGQYGMDPNRIAIWGDSAGGSLAMRVAASGQSGLAAAVGWSAPVNAYTAIFNSLESFAIGMDHSTCVPTDPDAIARYLTPREGGSNTTTTGTPVSGERMMGVLGADQPSSPAAAGAAATQSSQIAPLVSQVLALASQGMATSSNPQIAGASGTVSQLANTMGNSSALTSIYDPKSPTASEQVRAAAAASPMVATTSHTAIAPVSAETQRAVLAITDALGCQDNFRVLSPALNFAANTPPTFLVNAQDEYLVHPGQAIEYSNNLRAAGIDSQFLILPGNNHLGYDDRAVTPTFDFLISRLRP